MYAGNAFILCMTILPSLILQSEAATFAEDALKEHNKYRAKHGCPPLVLDNSLSAQCEEYAKELVGKDKLEHSDGPYGENLCYTSGNAGLCVKMWYDEIKDYNFDKAAFSLATGHFTQLIWKASVTLGVGKAEGNSGKKFVVARYKPAGNVAGAFKQNVPRPNASPCQKPSILTYFVIFSWILSAMILQAS